MLASICAAGCSQPELYRQRHLGDEHEQATINFAGMSFFAIAANAQTLDGPPIVSGPPLLPPPPISWIALINTDNIMEGNNGNPMRTLLAPGQSSAGAVGSIGRNDHQGLNGGLGNGQLRFAHNFGFAQFNISAGGLWGGNNDAFRGDTILTGAYVIPEIIAKIPRTSIYLTATGVYSPGQVNPNVSTLVDGFGRIGGMHSRYATPRLRPTPAIPTFIPISRALPIRRSLFSGMIIQIKSILLGMGWMR